MAMAVGARPIKAPGWSGGTRTDLALVDCDVHQTVQKPEDLLPYLSRVYRQQAIEQGKALAQDEMSKITGGLGVAGLGL